MPLREGMIPKIFFLDTGNFSAHYSVIRHGVK